jgi:FlaG/FlaF family flagellin (archaellin)
MSRAINVAATEAEVQAACRKHGATVTAIEALASGGTRVVFQNADVTATMVKAFGRKLLTGAVDRFPLRP